jgi:4-amino-4-deoxy-L-arabinose transferase-like glycosyltransferase
LIRARLPLPALAGARGAVARHPDLVALSLIVVVGAALRVAFSPGAPVLVHGDSYQYFRPAHALITGDGFPLPLKRPPVYPVFMAGVGSLLGQDLRHLTTVQHLLGVATGALVYGVGRLTFGRAVGLLAGLATVLSGGLLIYEHYILSEAVFTFLLVLGVLLYLLGVRRGGGWWGAAAGVSIALAALTRPHAQALLLLAPVAVVLCCRRWCPTVRLTVVAVLAAGALLVPWMARNQIVHGSFTVAGSSGQPLIDFTANHHAGQFRFYDPDDATDDSDPRLEDIRRFIQRQVDLKARNPAAEIMGITIQGWVRREFDLTEAEADILLRQVAVDAILARPVTYARLVLDDAARLLVGRPEELEAHWKGHHRTLRDSDNQPPRPMRPLIGPASARQEEQFGTTERLLNFYQGPRLGPVLPVLFLLGLVAGLGVPSWRLALAPALAVIALHAASAATVGSVARYHHPPDPLMHVVALGGALLIVRLFAGLARRLQRSRAHGPGPREEPGPPLPTARGAGVG